MRDYVYIRGKVAAETDFPLVPTYLDGCNEGVCFAPRKHIQADATIPGYRGLNERITRGDTKMLSPYADARSAGNKNESANTRYFAQVRSAAMFDNSAAQPAARA